MGYVWGRNIPMVVISKTEDKLQFDKMNYIQYNKIWELEAWGGQWLKQKLEWWNEANYASKID
jgi:hypothetical protein